MLDAATSAAAKHSEYFLTGLSNQLSSVPEPVYPIIERVAEHYARGGPEKSVGQILSSVSRYGGPRAESIISGQVRGWPKVQPPVAAHQTDKSTADRVRR